MTLDEYVTARLAEEATKRRIARAVEEASKRRPTTSRRSPTNHRGLVVSAPIEASPDGFLVKSSQLDPQELRFSLLFWDKLDYPSNDLIEIEPGPDAHFLMNAGILNRTHVTLNSAYGGDLVRLPLIRAFEMLHEKEPGTWSIATGERSISFIGSELQPGRGALVSLHRAIPVPDKDVPLDDILGFKRKRHAELLALRRHLEVIYARVAQAEDGRLALGSETGTLEKAVSDYVKSARGLGLKWRLADLTASVSLTKGTAVTIAAYASGLPAITSLVAGGVASLDIRAGAGLSRVRSTETPFRYVSSYHKELFPLS